MSSVKRIESIQRVQVLRLARHERFEAIAVALYGAGLTSYWLCNAMIFGEETTRQSVSTSTGICTPPLKLFGRNCVHIWSTLASQLWHNSIFLGSASLLVVFFAMAGRRALIIAVCMVVLIYVSNVYDPHW